MFAAAASMSDHVQLRTRVQQRMNSNFFNARAAQVIQTQTAVFDRETRRLNALLLESSGRVAALTEAYSHLHAAHQRLLDERNQLLRIIRNHHCSDASCLPSNRTIPAF